MSKQELNLAALINELGYGPTCLTYVRDQLENARPLVKPNSPRANALANTLFAIEQTRRALLELESDEQPV